MRTMQPLNVPGGKKMVFAAMVRKETYATNGSRMTVRWTCYDAKQFGITMGKEVPMTTRERAYTSPIWYAP